MFYVRYFLMVRSRRGMTSMSVSDLEVMRTHLTILHAKLYSSRFDGLQVT